ncbi:MAG: DNA-3-methyladenine glycosylase [Verrucomicrobiales bacterium]|jgi:DNA-3-methyladenine glycosylase|nr:DNA-3-methyladenine glycosylase [Verrucomicrobiales bacterium]
MATAEKLSLLRPGFFERDPLLCARELIGMHLTHGECSGRIIETEAHHEVGGPACHLFTRPSARKFVRQYPAGTAYVYLNDEVHWLVNVLTYDPASGTSGFVLFRSLEAVTGIPLMEERRGTKDPRRLCSGPGKLTAALEIGRDQHGHPLTSRTDFYLRLPPSRAPAGKAR